MRSRALTIAALSAALAGCSGGGSGGNGAPVAPIAAPLVQNSAIFPISIVVPNRVGASSSKRSPQYVSPGTASVAVYDGATLIYVGNYTQATQFTTVYGKTGTTSVTAGTCVAGASSQTCTLTITTTVGAHTFDVITYPVAQGQSQPAPDRTLSPLDVGTIPTFTGVILSEGELVATLSPGTNPGQTITLLGVADRAVFTGPVLTLHLNGNGPLVGTIGTTYAIQYSINDSSNAVAGGYQIVQPGDYDNGPVTIAETDGGNIVTMTAISQTTPPAAAGQQSFNVTCQNNGTATITASAKNKPNTAYASGLTYSAGNYATTTLGTTTLQCVPNSATLPITVQ